MKVYSLGQNCGVTELTRNYFNCESSFFDWSLSCSLGDSFKILFLNSNILKTIIYGQHQVIHDGNTTKEFTSSQFKLDNIFFTHYFYKDVEHIVTLVRRFCRTKLALNDLKNNVFIYSLNVPEFYKQKGYYYSVCLLKNQDIIKKIEDNVLFFNPFNCDLEVYDPSILKFKNVFNGNFKYNGGFPSKEVKSDINKWCSEILKDKFPQLKENNRTIKEKTNRIPDFFKEVYNTKDRGEFLYNVENLGIIKYIAEGNFTIKSNRNSIIYSNDYFSISAKNDNELWNKIFDFCMKSVKFTDNFIINKTT